MTATYTPSVLFCPFCGGRHLKFASGTHRCKTCRAVFFGGMFSRYTRKSPTKATP